MTNQQENDQAPAGNGPDSSLGRAKRRRPPLRADALARFRTIAVWVGVPLLVWLSLGDISPGWRVAFTAVGGAVGFIIGGAWYYVFITRYRVDSAVGERREGWRGRDPQ